MKNTSSGKQKPKLFWKPKEHITLRNLVPSDVVFPQLPGSVPLLLFGSFWLHTSKKVSRKKNSMLLYLPCQSLV